MFGNPAWPSQLGQIGWRDIVQLFRRTGYSCYEYWAWYFIRGDQDCMPLELGTPSGINLTVVCVFARLDCLIHLLDRDV
jgi:hypothetical protein